MNSIEHDLAIIQTIGTEAAEWRRELHRHPQTGFEETFASNFICEKLTGWGVTYERIAGTGVVATIVGRQNNLGRAIAFRADMDALDITEQSGQPWSSETPGKMHACGHDGHMATVLALGRYLNETRNFDGIVRLIFQPAEEVGGGASRMLEEGLLERFPFDEIYGYHNWPFAPIGIFAIRPGPMLAAVDNFEVTLRGKGGHAGAPHWTCDVVPALAHLILGLQTLVSRETDPIASAVVSVTNVHAGFGPDNIIAGKARLSGTVRTLSGSVRDHIEGRIAAMAAGVAATFNATAECKYMRLTEPVVNHEASTVICQTAASTVAGSENVRDMDPVMGGEDFGAFLQVRLGAFMAIGQAEEHASSPHNSGLHTPQYDFNDKIIPIAVSYFAQIAQTRLPID
jgi:amidohydrolase